MDTITHGILGALIGKAFFAGDPPRTGVSWREPPQNAGRVAIIATTLGAIFPDIDVFAGPLAHNSLAMMTWHRNITHSVVMLPVWAVLLAAITQWLARRIRWPAPGFTDLAAIYAVGLASHIFLDVITAFGTMVWAPLSYMRVAWDWVFIVDLSVTSLVLLPQLAAWAFQRPGRAARRALPLWLLCSGAAFGVSALVQRMEIPFPYEAAGAVAAIFAIFLVLPLRRSMGTRVGRVKWCRVGVALVGTYIAFAATTHHSALLQVSEFASENHVPVQDIAALPMPPSPAEWAGLIATPGSVYRLQFNELTQEPVKFQIFSQPASNRFIEAAKELRDVQTFLWFARFPLFQYSERDGQSIVQIIDLRYYGGRGGAPRDGSVSAPTSNFAFQVVFAPDGRVISHGFLRQE
jgi:membrane-bound metal-dependent hydrolase YbcI (DUF457 family)